MPTPRYFIFLCLVATVFGTATAATAEGDLLQHLLAPGEFSPFHKHISGIKNCSQCHSIGKGISSEKCLKCHKEISSRLSQKKGLHGKVKGECVDCHKDHGKAAISFKQENFDHQQADFHLTGRHQKTPCEKCHLQPEKQTGKKRFTYLGLAKDCAGCHKNPHEKRFAECNNCHTPAKWQKVQFDHNKKNRFKLAGRHQHVACKKCHFDLQNKGRSQLRFTINTSSQCLSCHKDQHKGQLPTDCLSCHNMKGWKVVDFDHNKAKFPLIGPHKKLSCKACHQGPQIKNVPPDCGGCHKKTPHNANHTPCNSCHTQNSWQQLQKKWQMQRDFHKAFKYPLQGAHAKVECIKCHENSSGSKTYFKMPFADCADCHKDKHQGSIPPPCSRCHQVESFKKLTLFDHEQANFKLAELHKAIACEKCHPEKDYKKAPTRCFRCHLEIARFSRGFYKHTTLRLKSPKAKIVACIGCHDTNVPNHKVTKETCSQCHEKAYQEFFSQWRQQFGSQLSTVQETLQEIKQCRVANPSVPDIKATEDALDFLQKDFEHNYRFSAALLSKLSQELSDINHAYCQN